MKKCTLLLFLATFFVGTPVALAQSGDACDQYKTAGERVTCQDLQAAHAKRAKAFVDDFNTTAQAQAQTFSQTIAPAAPPAAPAPVAPRGQGPNAAPPPSAAPGDQAASAQTSPPPQQPAPQPPAGQPSGGGGPKFHLN